MYGEWTNVRDAVPAGRRLVLATVKSPHGRVVTAAQYVNGDWRDMYSGRIVDPVLAWMDMPSAYGGY